MTTPLWKEPQVLRQTWQKLGQLLADPSQGNVAAVIGDLAKITAQSNITNASKFLSSFLRWKGKPFNLEKHFIFEELFSLRRAPSLLCIMARQVGKTVALAADSVYVCGNQPNINILHVTPLYEQIRRFSTMYIKPMIEESPLRHLLVAPQSVDTVLQREFINGSRMLFSFAALTCDRIRGLSADVLKIDEVQDLAHEHLPVIMETMSASPLQIFQASGTPKTFDNLIAVLHEESSMAEWFIPCIRCTTNGKRTWNIPCTEFHLAKMIGPLRDDITLDNPALICYKCGKPLYPSIGHWVHRYPERAWLFPGYHAAQPIMPTHYGSRQKWQVLLGKIAGRHNFTEDRLVNEVFGESFDRSSKLVSLSELDRVSVLGPNTDEHARSKCRQYQLLVLAVDWGGGGIQERSFTTMALLGYRFDGKIDVLWGKRLMTPHDHLAEAQVIMHYFRLFRPHYVAHDYTGAGALRETFLVQSGLHPSQLFAAEYVRAAIQQPVWHVPPTDYHPRDHYRVDKSRTLITTCSAIRVGQIRFFDRDYRGPDDPGLIRDFLSLTELKVQTTAAGELYRVGKIKGTIDDFAQAVNIGCACIWHRMKAWPDFGELVKYMVTEDQFNRLEHPEQFLQ